MTPRTDHYQNHPDTQRRRVRDSVRPLAVAERHFKPYKRLYAYRFDLPGYDLYTQGASREASALVGQTFPVAPAHWKLERGDCGGRHIHVTSPLPPRAVPGAQHAASVYDLAGWIAYLSKPSDSRLCRPGPLKPWTLDTHSRWERSDAAHLEYGDARRAALAAGRRRLSPMSGWVNTRSTRSTALSPRLLLAVWRFLLAVALSTPKNCRPLPGVHSRSARPPASLFKRPQSHFPRPLPPPRITQVQAR